MPNNYSESLNNVLEKSKIQIGNRIIVTKGKQCYEGFLMPRNDSGDGSFIVLKLDSGYNIGVKFGSDVEIKKCKEQAKKKQVVEKTKAKFDSKKPTISFISTGGTIVSRVDYKTGGVAPLEKPEDLLAGVPELYDIVNIKNVLNPISKASEDMHPKDWQKLADVVAKELQTSDGVVIAHGTDTMHYTSAALSFMLKNLSKPVVIVGSQRSSDRGSSDAAMNLICAAHLAVSDIAEVGICMHGTIDDQYCNFTRGTKARKMHSTRRDAFRSINEPPLAKVYPDGRIVIINNNYKKRSKGKVVADTKFEHNIAMLKIYPGSDPEILEHLVKKGYKGIVIEGTGMGHVPTNSEISWIPAIKKIIKKGIPIVMATQTIYGRVNTKVYTNLRILFSEAKAIPAEDMTPETAYVKLGFVLGHESNMDKVREMILTNMAGEITDRTEIDTFMV
ncbi:MAG: Glu-tRNA(Gln) amidotransferase subunit GatD [Candidatus Aenigmarchaeota archaeon]|nr:Glu-tRNA(Gln) amidotransferase subunit GatD [Candidatus Aenigmarchaeota archaeon]